MSDKPVESWIAEAIEYYEKNPTNLEPPQEEPEQKHPGDIGAKIVSLDQRRRPNTSHSYLTAVQLITDAAEDPFAGSRGILEGKTLAYNEMTDCQELDGRPIRDEDVSQIRANIERLCDTKNEDGKTVGIKLARADLEHAINQVAMQYTYHPVRDYLASLSWDGVDRISFIPDEILRTDRTPINVAMVRKWLISAVARALRPGVKADCMLVIMGGQGAQKSTFFKQIAGEEFFVDCGVSIDSKDVYLAIRQGWIVELGEMSALRSSKDIEAVKRFLSCAVDIYRSPYARRATRSPRSSIFGATANPSDILNDPTGARRFWVMTSNSVNTDLLTMQRDQIWAQAIALYQEGEKHWLNEEEEAQLAEIQKTFTESDAWEDSIIGFLRREDDTSVKEIMTECLEFEIGDITRADQMRVAHILRKHKWCKRISHGSARWSRPV